MRYECEPGYIRSGHPVILCMSNGTWSGDVPTCSSKINFLPIKQKKIIINLISGAKCPELPQIPNGFVTDTSREYFFNDEARVQCFKGYKLIGNNIIRCGTNQQFNNLPKCEGNLLLIF